MTETNQGRDQTVSVARRKRWGKVATALLLLLIVIVTGSAAIYARQEWWEMYMRLIH